MPSPSKNTILVVDDNIGARRSFEALLEKESYNVTLAEDGLSALKVAREVSPDLILLDVMMPGMNGFEVCQRIRSDPLLSEIPIIMVTALDDEDSLLQGIDAGADDFLPKPINRIELRARIRGILRLNRFRKLCDERRKFEIVVEQSRFGYILLDKQLHLTFANPAGRSMLSMGPGQIVPKPFFEIAGSTFEIHPSHLPDLDLSNGLPKDIESFLLVRSQTETRQAIWIHAMFQKFSNEARGPFLLRLEDISEQIITFQEKHSFSRMISHKLLTPLNALNAAKQLLAELDPESHSLIPKILELQTQGLSRLDYDIQSILGFLEGEQNLPAAASVGQLVDYVQQVSKETGLPVTTDCDQKLDTTQLIRISLRGFDICLREISENAIKFRGRASPELQCMITDSPGDDTIAFRFENNSKPMSDEELSKAWTPYWQSDRYFTGEIRGMGLGLSLISTVIWTAGGSCSIENRPEGAGVALTLKIPKNLA